MLKIHETSMSPSVNKFSMFCSINTSMPFPYKLKVFKAALTTSLIYSAESWITPNIKGIEKVYNKMVRILLGVRGNTPIQFCLSEIGLNNVTYEIGKKRKNFLKSKFNNIDLEEPFHMVFDLCRFNNTPGYRFLSRCMQMEISREPVKETQDCILSKPDNATKFVTYRSQLSPELLVHEVYGDKIYIPDYLRESFTRLRVMSHNLEVETGRWSRLPREERVCECDSESVQDERHVLLICPLVARIRQNYQTLNF